MKKLLFLLGITAMIMACSPGQRMSSTIKMMDIYGAGVIQQPVIAELQVDVEKISGNARGGTGVTIANVKNNAVADALRKSGADILIEPVYEIQTTGNSTHVTVTGFPGRYTNFRQAEPRDSLFIDSRILQKPQTVEQSESPSYRGSMLIPAIGIFVGTAVLAYFLGWGTAD